MWYPYGLFTWSKVQNVLQNVKLQKFCKLFADFVATTFCKIFANFFQQNFSKLIWNLDMRYLFLLLMFFSRRGCRMRRWWPLVPFFFLEKMFHKILQYFCKKCAKILQKMCKIFVKWAKIIFLLCKNFAKFLQILNLHTDFRPCEESVSFWKLVFTKLVSRWFCPISESDLKVYSHLTLF